MKLFSKFQVIYSHKWLSAIDTDELLALALDEWSERLHGLTGDEIKHGLNSLSGEWPPTPHEFRELCVGSDIHKTGAYKDFERPIAIEMSPDVKARYFKKRKREAKKSINKIRDILNN